MARRRRGHPVHGWVIVDKPAGVTSTAVVGKVRRAYAAQKAGHGGTLDPLATGLLPVALGEATKTVSFVMNGAKTYRFSVRWGEARDTDDSEGRPVGTSDQRPSEADIRTALPRYVGLVDQRPPAYSAIKVGGKRAYDLARSDAPVDLQPRQVCIHRLDLLGVSGEDEASFEIACGKGTYVRSLARDLGRDLGCLGHIVALRRTRVGPFAERDAIALADLEAVGHSAAQSGEAPASEDAAVPMPLPEALAKHLLPVAQALDDIPALTLTASEADRIRHGQPVPVLRTANRAEIEPLADGDTLWASAGGKPVALLRLDGNLVHPVRVLNL